MQSDADFLHLVEGPEPGTFGFQVTSDLARIDGKLYGGTAIAASITAAELVTGRLPLWMTTQFVSTAPADADVGVAVEVLAEGGRTSQVRVTGTDAAGTVMFASLGATGHLSTSMPSQFFERMPDVSSPEDADRWGGPFATIAKVLPDGVEMPVVPMDVGFHNVLEFREPEILDHPDDGPGRMCLWVRRRDGGVATPAIVAFMADLVPLSLSLALGLVAAGMSLDNTIRIGEHVPTGWVLLDLRPHLSIGGFGHGVAHAWTPDGHLLATASQTAAMRTFDIAAMSKGRRA